MKIQANVEHLPLKRPPQTKKRKQAEWPSGFNSRDNQDIFKMTWNSVTAELESDQICAVTWHRSTSSQPCNNPQHNELWSGHMCTRTPPPLTPPPQQQWASATSPGCSLSIFMRTNNISSVTQHTFGYKGNTWLQPGHWKQRANKGLMLYSTTQLALCSQQIWCFVVHMLERHRRGQYGHFSFTFFPSYLLFPRSSLRCRGCQNIRNVEKLMRPFFLLLLKICVVY